MRIRDFRVKNYKSWLDSEKLSLNHGFNIIIGQNNAGKTALLQSLSLNISNNPNRSPSTKPIIESQLYQFAKLTSSYELNEDEAWRLILGVDGIIHIPTIQGITSKQALEEIIKILKSALTLNVEYETNGSILADFERPWYLKDTHFIRCRVDKSYQTVILNDEAIYPANNVPNESLLQNLLFNQIRSRIYFFQAERLNIGTSQVSPISLLNPNSNNLAQVLNYLQTNNPQRFLRFNQLVSKVLPQIKYVTVPPISTEARILIWPNDPITERSDLAVSLTESGTGVGQVLAMIYVVVNSDYPQCILIDEPQSFLHPGAVRALLDIFRIHNQHQYILSTHSPAILSATSASIIRVFNKNNISKIEVVSPTKNHEIRLVLEDVGANLSDIFGAERILWVEGATEEVCFKLIIERLQKEPIWGTEILGVRNTGDLDGKLAEAAYDIYNKLSKGLGIIPPAVGFIFDREGRSEIQQNDLDRKSKSRVHFLKRRMFENYLINSKAISNVINQIPGFSNHPISSEEIEAWIRRNGAESKLVSRKSTKPFDKNWIVDVHGAHLLEKLFMELSETRVSYNKVSHGYLLTTAMINDFPEELQEIIDIINIASSTGETISPNIIESK